MRTVVDLSGPDWRVMWSAGAWWYLTGWLSGWLLLWRMRPLDGLSPGAMPRPAVAVVVPARDEALSLPGLLGPLVAACHADDEVLVVDDHSSDGTAAVATAAGARVLAAPDLAAGWLGKPAACAAGAAATSAPVLVFVDADVRPPPDLLDRVAVAVAAAPNALVSVQPHHVTERVYEQASLLPGVIALMGVGRFAVVAGGGDRRPIAFGPVLAVRRDVYDASGGHAHPDVRGAVLEDVALARRIGRSEVFTGRPDISFRMHPGGWREMVRGWTRSMVLGAAVGPWWAVLGVAAWVTSLAGGLFATLLAYPLSAVQVWVLGRRAGTFRWWAPLVYPVLVVAFVVMVVRAMVLRVVGRGIVWKGRDVAS
jgi:4,4'-diaponeurosporenoate glycosyltransferase